MSKNLIVVTSRKCLIAEEVDFVILALLDVIKRVGLVPALRKHIEGYLASNRISEVKMSKLFTKNCDEPLSDLVGQVKLFIVISLLLAAIAADGRYIQHAIAELYEGASLDWNVQIGYIMQAEVNEGLNALLP